MEQEAKLQGQDDTEGPQNPYQNLTEAELRHCIDQSKKEQEILEEKVFQKAGQQTMARDDAFLKNICDVRNSILNLQHRVGQIVDVLQERDDAVGEMENSLVREWRKMRDVCSRIDKKMICPLEQISHTIADYRYAFPNEKSTFLKKVGQVSAVTSIATLLSGFFFGDSLKAKAIAAGGGLVIGTVLVNMDQPKARSVSGRPLEAYKIRQVYAYLS